MVNSIIELHDSKVAAICQVGEQVIVFFSHAYIHTSEGQPGWDKGKGYWQSAALAFADGSLESDGKDLTGAVWEGDLEIEGHTFENEIPIPFNHTGSVILRLHIDVSVKIILRGTRADLTLIGEAVYVEGFPGAETEPPEV